MWVDYRYMCSYVETRKPHIAMDIILLVNTVRRTSTVSAGSAEYFLTRTVLVRYLYSTSTVLGMATRTSTQYSAQMYQKTGLKYVLEYEYRYRYSVRVPGTAYHTTY